MAGRKEDITFTITFNDKGSAKLKKILKTTETGLKKTQKVAENTTKKGLKPLGKEFGETTKAMSPLQKMLKSTWGQMAMGMGVMTGIQGAMRLVTNTVKRFITSGRDFEKAWSNVRTMIDENVVSQKKMMSSLLAMHPALGDATDLAGGLYQVLSASVDPAKALDVLKISAMAATAGVTSTAVAVDAITTVLNAYGMSADDAGKVSDIMFKTVKRGKLTFEQMASSIGTVATIAAQVGIRFEEIAGAVATMTKKGIDANTATMQLRQTLVAVLKPTKEAAETAKRLGIDFTSSGLKAKGLSGFLADISEKTKGNVEDMTMLFGNVRALTGVMALGGSSIKSFSADVEAMGDSMGSTEEAFVKQMDSMDFQLDMFKTKIKKTGQAFYMAFVQNFKLSIEAIKDWERDMWVATKRAEQAGSAWGRFFKNLWSGTKHVYNALTMQNEYNKSMDKAYEVGWKNYQTIENMKRSYYRLKEGVGTAKDAVIGLIDKYLDANDKTNNLDKSTLALLGTLEERGIKTIKQYSTQASIMEKELQAMASSGIVAQKDMETLAKEIKELKEKAGEPLSRRLKALSGDFMFLAEDAGTLTVELGAVATVLLGDFIPSSEKTKGSMHLMNQAMIDGFKYMQGLKEAALRTGTVLRTQLQKELRQTVEDFKLMAKHGQLTPQTTKDNLQKIISYYQKLGDEVPWIYKLMLMKAEKELKKHTKKSKGIIGKWAKENAKSFSKLGQLFGLLGEDIGGTLGGVFEALGAGLDQFGASLDSGVDNWKDMLESLVPVLGGIGGAIGEMIGGVEEGEKSFAKFGASIGSTIGGLFGPLGKAIGSIAGGLLGGLFKKKEAETPEEKMAREFEALWKSTQKSLSKFGKISDDLAQALAESRKEMAGFLAVSKHFGDVIRDVGVSSENVVDLWDRTTDILYHVRDGMLDGAEGTRALDDAFSAMLEGARALGNEGSWHMVNFIRTAREMGIEIESVTEYVIDQLMRIPDAIEAMVANVVPHFEKLEEQLEEGLLSEEMFDRKLAHAERTLNDLSLIAMSTFSAMMENGMSYMETIDAMRGPLDALRLKYEELGIQAPVYMQPLFDMLDLMELKPRVFENMNNAMTILEALSNTGYMTQEMFTALAQSATDFAKAILGVEGNLNKNIKAMLETTEVTDAMKGALMPIIMEFAKIAEMFQIEDVPAWMKKFVREATGMNWNQFAKEQLKIANAGVDTVAELIDLNRTQIRMHARLWDMKELLREIKNKTGGGSGAQHGFHGSVTGPHSFHIESGRRERVDITPAGQGAPTGHGGMVVHEKIVRITPILVPLEDQGGWLLDFIQEASEDERLSIARKSIKG